MDKKQAGEHTQGDWNLEENVDHLPFICSDDGNLIVRLVEKDNNLFYGRTHEETKANAKLIAAAPDMLKALELAKRVIKELAGEGWEHSSAKVDIEAAINKAKGL